MSKKLWKYRFLVFASFFLLAVVHNFYETSYLRISGVTVEGTITGYREMIDDRLIFEIDYKYENKIYKTESKANTKDLNRFEIGQTISLILIPENPKVVRINSEAEMRLLNFWFLLIGIMLTISHFAAHWKTSETKSTKV